MNGYFFGYFQLHLRSIFIAIARSTLIFVFLQQFVNIFIIVEFLKQLSCLLHSIFIEEVLGCFKVEDREEKDGLDGDCYQRDAKRYVPVTDSTNIFGDGSHKEHEE